ncbi:class I SAM-dependent methyltransferase [Catelliglobosispora koreensis]|uniref:class I SAM-dependent methyltransferase n=1 Tax=Catelliglobosispora koreensis TaxID=129052 RepID=UPI00037638B9|nr:class I SAM-dependent methyltransferase [Catelliglobosispora koreensis]
MNSDIRPDLAGLLSGAPLAANPGYGAELAWFESALGPGGPATAVIEVGCGTGATAARLTHAGYTVVGVEPSPVLLDIARHEAPDAIFAERDLHDLDGLHPVGSRFAGAVSLFGWQGQPRAQVAGMLSAISQQLKPGGALLMGMLEGDCDLEPRRYLDSLIPFTAYPREQLRVVLSRTGFTSIEISVYEGQAPGSYVYARCRSRA